MDNTTIEDLNDRVRSALERRKVLDKVSDGRALIITWLDERSPELVTHLDDFSRTLRDDYHYAVDHIHLNGSAERELKAKASALLEQAELLSTSVVIYYYGAVDVERDTGHVHLVSSGDYHQDRVSWSGLQYLFQQSPVDILVFVDDPRPVPQEAGENTGDDPSSLTINLPLDLVRGKLEVIKSRGLDHTSNAPFIQQLASALRQSQNWYTAHDIFRHLEEANGATSICYKNLSSQEMGSTFGLARVTDAAKVLTFTFDVTVTVTRFTTGATLTEQIHAWCLSSPPVTKDICLSRHMSTNFRSEERELTNLLTLRVEALESERTIPGLIQWTKQAPERLLISGFSSLGAEISRTQLTKSPRVPDDLTTWVEQRNKVSPLNAASSTRQGEYRRVHVVPIRWGKSDWDAKGEMDSLRSVFNDHFDYRIDPDLILPPDGDAQHKLDTYFSGYVHPGSENALASQDLLIVIYNGHGADGFRTRGEMILLPGKTDNYRSSVNWTRIARELDAAACDVVQILDCCYAATGTKTRGVGNATDAMLGSLHNDTSRSDYVGINETLGSSSRDSEAATNEYASTPVFARILRSLAERKQAFTVREWHHDIDTWIKAENDKAMSIAGEFSNTTLPGFSSPFYKLHPKESLDHSIVLRPKTAGRPQPKGVGAEGYVYAMVKLIQGDETETTYFTEDKMREKLMQIPSHSERLRA